MSNALLLKKLRDLESALHAAIEALQAENTPPRIDQAEDRKAQALANLQRQRTRLDELQKKRGDDKFNQNSVLHAIETAKKDLAAAEKSYADLS